MVLSCELHSCITATSPNSDHTSRYPAYLRDQSYYLSDAIVVDGDLSHHRNSRYTARASGAFRISQDATTWAEARNGASKRSHCAFTTSYRLHYLSLQEYDDHVTDLRAKVTDSRESRPPPRPSVQRTGTRLISVDNVLQHAS